MLQSSPVAVHRAEPSDISLCSVVQSGRGLYNPPRKGSFYHRSHTLPGTRIKITVTSTPPFHTINRAELTGIDIGLQLGHTHLLTDGACSLRLIQGYMNCPSAYRHNIHNDTLDSITYTLKTRCESCTRAHLGKIKAHNHSIGNDLADTLANQVADGHPPDTTHTTGSHVSIGYWTWPYTLIPRTLGEPMP
jgi:ribonuclease HI